MTDPPLLEVSGLCKYFPITKGVFNREVGRVKAVDGIDLTVRKGETVGIVGESGCGKSTAARSLLRLVEPTSGSVKFNGAEVPEFDTAELKEFRREAQMIFQDPNASFDPRLSIGEAVAEPLSIHGVSDQALRRQVVADLLQRVGLSADDIDRYPHEFSGGQKQRVALARALILNPDLLIADEPTSALDMSVQAEILTLLKDIQSTFDLGLIVISHDMGVIREICDRIAVMYLGEIVETAPTGQLFEAPKHPYTEVLISSIPAFDPRQRGQRLTLSGDVPSAADPPTGCRFHTRCPKVIPPDEFDIDQQAWRAILDLRHRLTQEGIDPDTVREFVAADTNIELSEVTENQIKEAIRGEFDIPLTVGDLHVEQIVQEVLEYLIKGDDEAARDLLVDSFTTICATQDPNTVVAGNDHRVACHLVEASSQSRQEFTLLDEE